MSWTPLGSRTPVARKEHQCDFCCQPIYLGEKHHHWWGVMDGEWQSTRACRTCNAYFDRIQEPGELYDFLEVGSEMQQFWLRTAFDALVGGNMPWPYRWDDLVKRLQLPSAPLLLGGANAPSAAA